MGFQKQEKQTSNLVTTV